MQDLLPLLGSFGPLVRGVAPREDVVQSQPCQMDTVTLVSETVVHDVPVTTELFNRQSWRTNLQLAVGIADYIENFYNVARLHSALGYLTSIEFEDLHSTPTDQAASS
jgi:transposase InsO family protein